MNSFSKILLAFDGSEDSVTALKKAEMIARLCEASLTVVYVESQKMVGHFSDDASLDLNHSHTTNTTFQQPFPLLGASGIPIYAATAYPNEEEQPENNNRTLNQPLSDAKATLSDALKNVKYELLAGDPAEVICHYAKENHIDLIIVGNRGIGGIKKLILGSVSDKVTHLSECPVLVVK